MNQAKTKTYTGIAGTAAGADQNALAAQTPVWAGGGGFFNRYAIQVKGEGAAATTWSVTLEGSLDGKNWTTLATHSATDGSTVFAIDKPCLAVRATVGTLTLGSATAIDVYLLAAP
jgi:hypothetical protein